MDNIPIANIVIEGLLIQKQAFEEQAQELETALLGRLRTFEFEAAKGDFDMLVNVRRLAAVTEEIGGWLTTGYVRTDYLGSADLLYEAFGLLGQMPTERILYVGGNRFGSCLTLTKMIPVGLEKSDRAYAAADTASSVQILSAINRRGGVLAAYLHMHPGKGAGSTLPSDIDRACQARLEKGGYPAIGGIFSRDGYVRFFTNNTAYNLTISGRGVENIGQALYRLDTKI